MPIIVAKKHPSNRNNRTIPADLNLSRIDEVLAPEADRRPTSVYLSKSIYARFKQTCEALDFPMSRVFEEFMLLYIQHHLPRRK